MYILFPLLRDRFINTTRYVSSEVFQRVIKSWVVLLTADLLLILLLSVLILTEA